MPGEEFDPASAKNDQLMPWDAHGCGRFQENIE
jgi:hypothetical protein